MLIDSFRDAMAQVGAPVSIVTTAVAGIPYGATVSAFASLSLRPPMVLMALDNRGSLVGRICAAKRFGLNILGAHQVPASRTFALPGAANRFEALDWTWDEDPPRITGSAGWVACELAEAINGGDHTLFLGRVLRAASEPVAPLNYHQRKYGTITPL